MTKFFETFGIYSCFNVCSHFHLTHLRLPPKRLLVVKNSPGKPFAHQECSTAERDLEPQQCRAVLDENTQEAPML